MVDKTPEQIAAEKTAKVVADEKAAAEKAAKASAGEKAAADKAAAKAAADEKAADEKAAAKTAATEKATATEAKKYRVLRPLSHNNRTYPVDGEVSLADEHAEPLLAQHVVTRAVKVTEL